MAKLHPTIWSRLTLLAVITLIVVAFRFWPQPQPIPVTAVGQPVLAVLHFENRSDKPDSNFFAEGFTCELIVKAGQLCTGKMGVIAHDSVISYQKAHKSIATIGRELDADYILDGGFEQAGKAVHVTANLVRVSDQSRLWSEDYDDPIGDLSQMQVAIIQKVASTLGLNVNPNEIAAVDRASTKIPAAREAYLRAIGTCQDETEKEVANCISLYEKALAADHVYGRAYAGLADAYIQHVEFGQITPAHDYKLAEESARKAIEIEQGNPQAHHVLGEILYRYDHDPKTAEDEFRRALAMNTSDSKSYLLYAGFLLDQGRSNDAQTQISYALAFDPFSMDVNIMAGRIETRIGSYDRAIQQLEKTVSLNRDFPPGHYYLGEAYLAHGMTNDAIREFQKAISFKQNVPEFVAGLGRAYAAAGQWEEAKAQLEELKKLAQQQAVEPVLMQTLEKALAAGK